MILLDLLHAVLNLDTQTAPLYCDGVGCPGSTVSAIAAAYGTQGMWVLADLVDQIMYTNLGALGPLLYVVAAVGGLTSLAIGAPPRTYMWFFLGPAIYRWLLGTSVPAMGMAWQMGGRYMDQREVWRLSEVGLTNSNLAWKGLRNANGSVSGATTIKFYNNKAPTEPINVPYFFAYYDSVVSGTVQGLIMLTGMYSQRASTADDNNTSISKTLPLGSSPSNRPDDQWFMLTNKKWGTIQNITDARVASPHLRTSLTRFFGGECGERFASIINPTNFLSAMYGKGQATPSSIFNTADNNLMIGDTEPYVDGDAYSTASDPLDSEQYSEATNVLSQQLVPFPRELRKMLADDSNTGYRNALHITETQLATLNNANRISCKNYLKLIVAGFRWESSRIFSQIMAGLPPETLPEQLVFNLLYGWNVRKASGGSAGSTNAGDLLTLQEQEYFIRDLIFVHLVRNEMAVARPALGQAQLNPGQLSSRMTSDSAEGHLRFVAVKNKSSEFYQWAMMMPHMQGILLYFLCIGYPFACLLLILPGMHKTLFTWMSFWAWAKLWDLGFAMVMALERSVWAMLGSNANIGKTFGKIVAMQKWGILADGPSYCNRTTHACTWVFNQQVAGSGGMQNINIADSSHWVSLLRLFDRALTVGANLDLDLQNSYYVYIMAGLYFAVPVVAGQLVLGSKAGMSSLVGNVIGAVGQEAGRQAAQGYTGDLQNRMKTNFNAASQAAYGAAMRQTPLLAQAMEAGNSARLAGMQGDFLQQQSGLTGAKQELAGLSANSSDRTFSSGYPAVKSGPKAIKQGIEGAMAWRNNGGLFTPGPSSGAAGAPSPSAASQLVDAGDTAVGGVLGLEAYRRSQEAIDNNAAGQMKKTGYSIDGFAKKTEGTAWDAGSQNYGKFAEYEGQWAAWDERNAFASSMSATAASLGGLPGGMEAGNMPQDSTGMAMNGEMSSAANKAVRWADPYNSNSGFAQERGSRLGALRAEQSTLPSYYQPTSVGLMGSTGGKNAIGNYGYAMSIEQRPTPTDVSPIGGAPSVSDAARAEAEKQFAAQKP